MGGGSKSQPTYSASAEPAKPVDAKGYHWEGDNLVITGNVTGEEVAKAQAEKKAAGSAAAKANSPSLPGERETPEDIAAREAQTLKNPKKQRLRGNRTLTAGSPLGISSGSKETLG